MPFVAAPNIILLEWRYTLFGQKCENTMHLNNFGDPTAAQLQVEAINAWNWWENTYSVSISENCALREVVATDIGSQNGEQYTYAPDTTTVGQATGQSLPNETSLCISLRSASRGRSARGRWFMAGIPDSARVDANNVSSAYATAVVTALQTLIQSTISNSKQMTVVSRVSNGIVRPGGPVYFPIVTALLVDTILDSQRPRKPGVGS